MGGFLATESVLSCISANERPHASSRTSSVVSILPYIQGVMAFDTPYLGIAPSVLVYGAEVPYQSVHALYESRAKGYGLTWREWVPHAIVALFLAGSAYFTKSVWMNGWEWLSSHLVFVECLLRRAELKSRLDRMMSISNQREIGFVNLFVVLGEWGSSDTAVVMEKVARGEMRSFCEVTPDGVGTAAFHPLKNVNAKDEITAHMSIFAKQENPGYEQLKFKALHLITGWVQRWYSEDDDSWTPDATNT